MLDCDLAECMVDVAHSPDFQVAWWLCVRPGSCLAPPLLACAEAFGAQVKLTLVAVCMEAGMIRMSRFQWA